MKKLIFILTLFLLSACVKPDINKTPQVKSHKPTKPKNIILMIGDGMGLTQITAGMYSNGNKLNLERTTNVGIHKPYSSSSLITDSAAGATAFACGVKSYNGCIGVGPDSLTRITILEEAENNGMATGLVATSTIVHATPASFIAHEKRRNRYEEIADDFLKVDIDLFIGGGKKFFTRRKDKRNLVKELEANNYNVSDFVKEELEDLTIPIDKNFAYFTANEHPLPVSQGRDYLKVATEKSLDFLKKRSSDNGFFIMIEASQIDWGGHSEKSDYIVSEMIDFDKSIGSALDFAQKDGETLVIITADHETGGYAISNGSTMDSLITAFTTNYHTGVMIPVFAYGPGAEEFNGIYENTEIYHKMRKLLFDDGLK